MRITEQQKALVKKLSEKGLDQRSIAAQVGISQRSVGRILNPAIKEREKAWRQGRKPQQKKISDQWYQNNKERAKLNARRARAARPDHYKELSKTYYRRNKSHHDSVVKEWARKNPGKRRLHAASRRAALLDATPSWLTTEHWRSIEELYKLAAQLSADTGVEYEVDHIHPLKGKAVCGLHVPWNLRVITAKENREKSNRLEQ